MSDPRQMQRALTPRVVTQGANSFETEQRYADDLEQENVDRERDEWEGLSDSSY